eukprot:1150847-Pelagomonas_calceolata.AAC.4
MKPAIGAHTGSSACKSGLNPASLRRSANSWDGPESRMPRCADANANANSYLRRAERNLAWSVQGVLMLRPSHVQDSVCAGSVQ